MTIDNRHFERFPIARIAFAESTDSGDTCCGVLKNISVGGAMIDLKVPFMPSDHIFEIGMAVEVNIDEFDPLWGEIVRATPTIIGVKFDHEGDQQDHLLTKILNTLEEEGATASP
jgi:hypothetical protein